MEDLIAYLLQFGQLDEQQRDLILSKAKCKSIAKGDYFSEAGKISRQIGYVTQGIFRICYYDRQGDDITRYFVYESRFAVDINSFRDQTPSAEYIEAVTDCQVLAFSKDDFTELAAVIPGWQDIFVKITSYVLENKLKFTSNMLVQDAQTRYLNFLDHYPGLANRVPLAMIASYLGITPSSLSRVRKSIL
jgi:CRP-like cAMP-binding protein